MKKKLAVYVGINLLIWIMLLFVPSVSSYIYGKINRTYDSQPLGYLYLYEGIIVILLNLSSALVFLAGKWVRLLCCACTCALTVILLINRPSVPTFMAMVLVMAISGYVIHLFRILPERVIKEKTEE